MFALNDHIQSSSGLLIDPIIVFFFLEQLYPNDDDVIETD